MASAEIAHAIEANTDADLTGLSLRDESEGVGGESLSPFRLALAALQAQQGRDGRLVILMLIVLACLFPSIPARYGEAQRLPKTATTFIHAPPSAKAWFGTDDLNRDLYSRSLLRRPNLDHDRHRRGAHRLHRRHRSSARSPATSADCSTTS